MVETQLEILLLVLVAQVPMEFAVLDAQEATLDNVSLVQVLIDVRAFVAQVLIEVPALVAHEDTLFLSLYLLSLS